MINFKQNSVGRRLFINAKVDLTTVSNLVLNIKKADGSTLQLPEARITIVNNDNEVCDACGCETWLANQYCFITWEAGDLNIYGLYNAQLAGDFPGGFDAGDLFIFKVEENIVITP